MTAGKKILGALVALIAAFLAGWYPEHQAAGGRATELAAAQEQNGKLTADLKQSQVLNQGALLYLQVVRQDWVQAAKSATEFFDGVQELSLAANVDATDKARYDEILSKRDKITADLALADPMTPSELQAILLRLYNLPTQ